MINISNNIPPLQLSLASNLEKQAVQDPTEQDATSATSTTPSLTVALAAPTDITATSMYKDWQAQAAVGQATGSLANAVTSAFTSILAKRPDLADVQFDFTTDNGAIRVTSNDLSDADRKWLDQELNADASLVNAVTKLNATIGATVSIGGTAPGDGSTQSSPAGAFDGSIQYLSLLQKVADKAGQTGWLNDTTYTDDDGRSINLAQTQATSLAGMIDLKRQLDDLQGGTINALLGNGQIENGAEHNPDPYFAAAAILAEDMPGTGLSGALYSNSVSQGALVDRMA